MSQIVPVAAEIRRVLDVEKMRLEEETNRYRRILDTGTDTVLSISSRNNTPRSARSNASDADSPTGNEKKGYKRCLSCGDRLLTAESSIKVLNRYNHYVLSAS